MNIKKLTLIPTLFVLLFTGLTYNIVLAEEESNTSSEQTSTSPLVLPEDDSDTTADKKCLTICKEWGESCVINPRTGNRNCRRTCKQLGEECI